MTELFTGFIRDPFDAKAPAEWGLTGLNVLFLVELLEKKMPQGRNEEEDV
mgnify:CR=1 FL=1